MQFRRLSEYAYRPMRVTKDSAGADLYLPAPVTLSAKSITKIHLDLMLIPPPRTLIKLESKSGIGSKYALFVLCGIIDPDYRGNISVVLLNFGLDTLALKRGTSICQAILLPIILPELIEIPPGRKVAMTE